MKSNNFEINSKKELVYLTIPSFDKTNIVNHLFSTKMGGVSTGIYESMNLGFDRGDLDNNVLNNFKIICEAININYKDLVFSNQLHNTNIKVVSKEDKGKGITKKSDIIDIDGLITNEKKVPLVTFYADCVPLFYLDPVKEVIALTHAGWRGTVKKIASLTIDKMIDNFNCNPKDILVGIGPSIGQCCFEVDKNVADEFKKVVGNNKNIISKKNNNKYMIDLWNANKLILLDAGINPENLTIANICTKCNSGELFSHRATGGKRGSLAAIMELK